MQLLRQEARPAALPAMARYGVSMEGRLGISVPSLRRIGKLLGQDHQLALDLWETRIPEAQILAGLVAKPASLTSRQMDQWAVSIRSWDVCDGACINAFVRTSLAWGKVVTWSRRPEEFVRRAGFALLAALAVHDESADSRFIVALDLVEAAAADERKLVKRAVSWALRGIGKRNPDLRTAAIACAERLRSMESAAARWIAADALRELSSSGVDKATAMPSLDRRRRAQQERANTTSPSTRRTA